MTNEPTSPRAARSREKMLRAATDLLVESGPRAVTVDAVADRSGVAKSTLYRHWPSRDEMLIDVVRCNMPELDEPTLTDGFEVALRRFIGQAASTLADPEWSRIIPAMMALRVTMPELAALVDSDQSGRSAFLAAILRAGVDEGLLPGDIDTEAAATLLFGPLLYAALTGGHEQIGSLADFTVDHFIASYRR